MVSKIEVIKNADSDYKTRTFIGLKGNYLLIHPLKSAALSMLTTVSSSSSAGG